MDTVWEIKVFANRDVNKSINKAKNKMKMIVSHASFLSDTSEISILNRFKELKNPSNIMLRLFSICKDLYKYTDGYFDPSIYPLMDAYGFYDNKYRVPSEEDITKTLKEKVGFDFRASKNSIFIYNNEKIDYGAMIKGFVVDRISEYLIKNGVKDFIVNFGEEMAVSGKKGNKKWNIGIRNPQGNGLLGSFEFQGYIATSGDYERFFIIDGKKYSHLISPYTGACDTNIHSVSVIADNCAKADALATAICVMGIDKAKVFIKKNGIKALVVGEGYRIERYNGFPKLHK